MKQIPLLFLGLVLLASSCARESSSTDAPSTPSSETSHQEDPKPMPETQAPVAIENKAFKACVESYPILTLPASFPQINPEAGKEWASRPLSSEGSDFLFGSGKIELVENEEAFSGHRFPLSDQAMALITFVMGDFNERLVLTTHKREGDFIDKLVLASISEEEDSGFASEIQSDHKVYQQTVFQIYHESSQSMVPEVDGETVYQLQPDGKIVKE